MICSASQLPIVEAFTGIPDTRRTAGQRHHQALCLAGLVRCCCRESWISRDWGLVESPSRSIKLLYLNHLKGAYPPKRTIRRTLLRLEYQTYSGCLSRFFGIQPLAGETISLSRPSITWVL